MDNSALYLFLFSAFILAGLVHVFYYLFIFSRLAFYKSQDQGVQKNPVSVIIAAKNEFVNLLKYLHAVLEQSYHDYEVIVVNDCSWDKTGVYLDEMKKKYAHLKVVTIPEQDKYKHGKKFAITLGIKAAKNEVLLFTDADCMPVSKNWISTMQRRLTDERDIVLGYGAYQKGAQKSSFLNKLIRFDTFMIAMQYFSFALKENAYMGVGRNLCYRKSLFFRNKGFANHYHVFSGDDDLFVNETAGANNVAIQIDKESFTVSDPKKIFREWIDQKRRHVTTSKYYKAKHRFQIALLSISEIVFLTLFITLLILHSNWESVLVIYVCKLVAEWMISFLASKKLNESDLMWLYPFLKIVIIVLQPVFYLSSILNKKREWK